MNIGHSSNLLYDQCAYDDRYKESTDPLRYRVNENNIANCDACLSTLGPRSGFLGYGVSNESGDNVATSQKLVDVESLLSNRNIPTSKCKDGNVNHIDMTKLDVKHPRTCDKFLDPVSSRLTNPASTYRGGSINRFYNLPKNPQEVVFWNFAVNSTLEAKDNYIEQIPELKRHDPSHPVETKGLGPRYPTRVKTHELCPSDSYNENTT